MSFHIQLITCICLTCTSYQAQAAHSDSDTNKTLTTQLKGKTMEQQEVLQHIHKMTEAFHKGDLAAVMACYEKKSQIVFEAGSSASDHKVSEQIFAQLFPLKPQFRYGKHEVIIAGDIALHITPWTMKASTEDGQEITDSGLSVAVLRRQKDRSWLLLIDNPYGANVSQQ